MTDATRYAVENGVASITLARSDSRNALSAELVNSLGDHVQRAIGDDAVRVVTLTNEGPTFCAGADLNADGDTEQRYSFVDILEAIMDAPKPVVARIAGHCMGGGVGLAAACDISIAAADAQFGFSEVRLGVAPAIISVVVLPKLRRGDALELFLSGKRIDAARAADIGLVNRAVQRDGLDEAVAQLTAELLAGGPNALAAAKQLISRVPAMPRREAFEWTEERSAELFRSDEAAAGIAAFRSRQTPPWAPKRD